MIKEMSRDIPSFIPIPKEIADSGLQKKMEEILNSEVYKRLNAEFNQEVLEMRSSEKRKREREWEKARRNFVPTPDIPELPRPPPENFHILQA